MTIRILTSSVEGAIEGATAPSRRRSGARSGEAVAIDGQRVLFLAPVPDFKGGAERSLMDLLANSAIRPVLVVPAEGPLSRRADELGIEWEVLDLGRIGEIRRPFRLADGLAASAALFAVARRLVEIAHRREAVIVHSNGLKAHAIALAARLLGGPPAVIHIRDIANTRMEWIVWSAFQRLSDRTILVSRACWPTSELPRNVHVIHNGIRVRDHARRRGAGNGDLILGFVGRIHPFKGLHVLLPAIGLARRRGASVRLVVRGAFAPETPEYESEIRDLVEQLGLADIVSFEGFISDPDLVYDGLDVICVPSIAPEPFGRAAMEAMGRGLPVIAAPTGGLPELVRDGETGFLAEEPEAVAAIIARLERDPGLRDQVGRRAHEFCMMCLTVERLHEQVRTVYGLALRETATGR